MTPARGRTAPLARVLGWAASIFQRIRRRGGPAPDGPLLVVANHPNSLLDPLVLFRVLGRPTRPLAKAPLFQKRGLGWILRQVGGLPVYRAQDFPGETHRNKGTFDAVSAALRQGDAVQIYPEGISHSLPGLAEVKTGAARIALQAEDESGWSAGVHILPVGLNYRRKNLLRGEVLANVGEPMAVQAWQDRFRNDPREAARALTDDIRTALETLVVSLASPEEVELVEVADRIWSRERGEVPFRAREDLQDRFDRLKGFARAAAWLRDADPPRYHRLAAGLRRYGRLAGALGTGDAEVPPGYRFLDTLRYLLERGGLLLVGLPIAAAGSILWAPTWWGTRWVVRRIETTPETESTYKLASGAPLALVNTVAAGGVTGWLAGWAWGVALALAMIPVGLLTLGWHERWRRVREDVRLYLRLLGRPERQARLAGMRQELVDEMESIWTEMDG